MAKKVGVSFEEQQLPYYKYFLQDLAPIPQDKLEIWKNGQPDGRKGVPAQERNRFLAGTDGDWCQLGYGVQDNGTGYVCNTTYMPGVTSEMLDWWFPWHSVGSDLRYKIWDPEDHYFARADNAAYVCDPAVPMNQKTWGVNHYILEDVGFGPDFVKLCFKSPTDFGYDPALIGTDTCASLVCAVGEGSCPAAMTHKWYPYQEGVLFCSRFWIGYGMVEGKLVKVLPEGVRLPDFVPQNLFGHNIKEFSNLAAILPQVYAENHQTL